MKRQEVTKKHYEFLKALRAKLQHNGGAAMAMTSFTQQWGLPPATVTVLKNMGWLESKKNVQRKWVYSLNLEQVEPWHGETLRKKIKDYVSNHKGTHGVNSHNIEVEGKIEGEKLKAATDKAKNQKTFNKVKEKIEDSKRNKIDGFSDRQLKEELESRGYVVELWKKVKF